MASNTSNFAKLVAASLRHENFTLIDIGCAGGIASVWRAFSPRLEVLAIDASVSECQRLAAQETLPNIEYIAAFAGIGEDHPFAVRRGGRPDASRNPWQRLSTSSTVTRREAQLKVASDEEKIHQSSWWLTKTADPTQPVVVPDLLRSRNMMNVDFLKVDTDGNDFAILNSFDASLGPFGVLGALLEVNFCGSASDTDRTFHNVDRFMKAHGFEIFDLSVRRYSAAALPARYELDFPAQTVRGRILQGDALYVRDWAAPEWADAARSASPEKILKLAAIFAVHGLPDCAAEIVIAHKDRLNDLLDVGEALNVLAAQSQEGTPVPLSYAKYLKAFEADAPSFYPPRMRKI